MIFLPDNLLSVLILLPLTGILFILQINHKDYLNIRNCSLWISIFCLFVTILLFFGFDAHINEYQFVENFHWIPSYNIRYHIGIDSISLVFLLLLTALVPVAILLASAQAKENFRSHMIFLLCLESFLIGSFCALDIVLFYIFSEAAIASFLFIVNMWGSSSKQKRNWLFLVAIAVSSILFLIIFLKLSYDSGSTTIQQFKYFVKSPSGRHYLFYITLILALFLRNGILPIVSGLQKAYQGLTRSASFFFSVIINLNGLYYIIRFLPLVLNQQNGFCFKGMIIGAGLIFVFAIACSVYYAKQKNFWMLLPNIVQINACYVILGILIESTFTQQGVLMLLINYSFVISGVFLLILFLDGYSSVGLKAEEKLIVFFMISYLFLSYLGIPGTLGFYGNALIFLGLLKHNFVLIAFLQLFILLLLFNFGIKIYYQIISQILWQSKIFSENVLLDHSQTRHHSLVVSLELIFIVSVLVFLTLKPQFILEKVSPFVS